MTAVAHTAIERTVRKYTHRCASRIEHNQTLRASILRWWIWGRQSGTRNAWATISNYLCGAATVATSHSVRSDLWWLAGIARQYANDARDFTVANFEEETCG